MGTYITITEGVYMFYSTERDSFVIEYEEHNKVKEISNQAASAIMELHWDFKNAVVDVITASK